MEEKFEYASPQWVKYAKKIILDLFEKAGDSAKDTKYSVCEIYQNAPSHLRNAKGEVSWHFSINGNDISVESGEIDNVDFKVVGDYNLCQQIGRLLNGVPEDMKKWGELAKEGGKNGKLKWERSRKGPVFLAPLHNILAKITK